MTIWRLALVLIIAFISGCASAPTASQLSPEIDKSTYTATNRTLTIADVTEKQEQKSTWSALNTPLNSTVDPNTFKQALINTIKATGMFKEVSINSGDDYLLSAQIIAQRMEGSFTETSTLLIRYRLVESATGNTIWSGNIYSEKTLSTTDVFMGTERTKKLLEITVNDNLSKLMAELNKTVSQRNVAK